MNTIKQRCFGSRVLGAAALAIIAACAPEPRRDLNSQASAHPTTMPYAVEPIPAPISGDVFGSRCMVAADHPVASEAGLEILRQGGNAVDAAVAVSFTLSVVRPESCGIGGGGFMLIHLHNDPRFGTIDTAIDYRERAPDAATPDMFEKLGPHASTRTGAAVAVPGTVAGLLFAHDKYGKLQRWRVMEPAIRAAITGFTADRHHVNAWREHLADRGAAGVSIFVRDVLALHGQVKPGDHLTNQDQAYVLSSFRMGNAQHFYHGEVANAIIDELHRTGGIMTLDDLRSYQPKEVKPLVGRFMGRRVLTMPPPSSGGIALLQILGTLERRPEFAAMKDIADPRYVHLLAEAMKHAFADRARYLCDPEFADVPVDRLLDPAMLDARAAAINPQRAADIRPLPRAEDGGEPQPLRDGNAAPGAPPQLPDDHGTSHFCVVDAMGNAVACTETINLEFGSGIAVPGFGFCLNNEMDDFLTRRGEPNAFGLTQAEANLPGPRKRPLSSMTPTIVLDDRGDVEFIAGGSGGPRIISATAQSLINSIQFQKSADGAISARRVHHQWVPDRLELEPQYATRRRWNEGWCWSPAEQQMDAEFVAAMEALGYTIGPRDAIAQVQLIQRTPDGEWNGASDPRKGGRAAGE